MKQTQVDGGALVALLVHRRPALVLGGCGSSEGVG